jgi:hypothetical protein
VVFPNDSVVFLLFIKYGYIKEEMKVTEEMRGFLEKWAVQYFTVQFK